MKKLTIPMLLATALVAISCSNENNFDEELVDGKSLIYFGSANNSIGSRAGFGANTRILAQIVSEPRTGADPSTAKYTKAVLIADPDGTQSETTYSNVGYSDAKKYWDDAHGRFSRLSVYAVAIPSQTTKIVDGNSVPLIADNKLAGNLSAWENATSVASTIEWSVSPVQTATELNEQDLTYSNNIQETGDNGCYIWDGSDYPKGIANASKHTKADGTNTDGRLHFEQTGVNCDETPTDAAGHFDRGQMAFKHSLSRIRVKIVKGSTFEGTFAFASGTTIQLNNMPISGTLDIKYGTWAASPTIGNITKMAPINVPTSETGYEQANAGSLTNAEGAYEAQMLPGFEFSDARSDNVMEFNIDGNKYFVTNKEMMSALKNGSDVSNDATSLTTEQGKRYVFTVNVGKTKIESITATIVPWINVTAQEQEVNNSHVTFDFLAASGTTCNKENIFFYKHEHDLSPNVYTDNSYTSSPEYGWEFGDPATLTGDAAPYSTGWYYKDNSTAYHFRTLNLTAKNALDATDKNKFTITTGSNDYHWGAPMKTDANLKYDIAEKKGFVGNIAKGIVSATSETQLKITELHMMSQIIVTLKNDETAPEADRVNLSGATVTITGISKTGTVDMATGYITPAAVNSSDNSQTMDANGSTANSYILSVVPQSLKRGTGTADYVGIKIETTDHNVYYLIEKLSDINATANNNPGASNQGATAKIERWYPNHSYTYTFTLKKTGISLMSATVANWINVTAANQDITLE